MAKIVDKKVTTATDVLLALATLGGPTQIGSFLCVSLCPRWLSQEGLGEIADVFGVNFVNVNAP